MQQEQNKTRHSSEESKASTNVEKTLLVVVTSPKGLTSLQTFLSTLPMDVAHRLVVALESPTYPTPQWIELLQQSTSLPVYEAVNGGTVLPGCVTLLPPKQAPHFSEGKLRLEPLSASSDRDESPLHTFLVSMTAQENLQPVALWLTGKEPQSLHALQALHRSGTLLVFEPSVRSHVVGGQERPDHTLFERVYPPEEMWQELSPLLQNKQVRPLDSEDEELAYQHIINTMNTTYGLDLRDYKYPVVLRWLQRRMVRYSCPTLHDYRHLLEQQPDEEEALYRACMNNFTQFFRDPPAWHALGHEVLVRALQSKATDSNPTFKAWVVGCSTGEEAYSLGMLLSELQEMLQLYLPVTIFATDVKPENVQHASAGVFQDTLKQDVGSQRLERFFTQRGDTYVVNKQLRSMFVFSKHNVLTEPPLHQMDLIVCRNVLMYMKPNAQDKVLKTLHFSLRQFGILFLGPSESLGTRRPHFDILERRWCIFRCHTRETAVVPSHTRIPAASNKPNSTSQQRSVLFETLSQTLLEETSSACVFLNADLDVIHASGQYQQYLSFPSGSFSTYVMSMIVEPLQPTLSVLLQKVQRNHTKTEMKELWSFAEEQRPSTLKLLAAPVHLPEEDADYYILLFVPEKEATPSGTPGPKEESFPDTHLLNLMLEQAQFNLQVALAETQETNVRLQQTNLELATVNEELQGMNEELQSMNEELQIINTENQIKNEELEATNADLNNLLGSTQIGTMFLDREMRIRRFTTSIEHQFSLLPHDVGRPLQHLSSKLSELDMNTMQEHIAIVLAGGEPQFNEIQTLDGTSYLKRIFPFLNSKNEIDGVVLTFVDITMLKRTQHELERRESLLRDTEQAVHVGSWEIYLSTDVCYWSDEMYQIFGLEKDLFKPTTESLSLLVHPEDRELWEHFQSLARTEDFPAETEVRIVRPSGDVRYLRWFEKGDREGPEGTQRIHGFCHDITPRVLARKDAKAHENQFRIFFENSPIGLCMTSPEGNFLRVNPSFAQMVGYSVDELQSIGFAALTHPDDMTTSQTFVRDLLQGKQQSGSLRKRYLTKEGDVVWGQVQTHLHRDEKGTPRFFLTSILDITEQKKSEEMRARFQSIFNATEELVSFVDTNYIYRAANEQYLRYWDAELTDIIDRPLSDLFPAEVLNNIIKPHIDTCLAGGRVRYQNYFEFPGKGTRYMDVMYNPVYFDATRKRCLGVAVNVRDITDMKANEEKLEAALDELERSNYELEQFAYAASHDLQEPLNTIANLTGLLHEDYKYNLDKLGLELIEMTHDSALRMKRMISALLQFSRLRRAERSDEPLDISELLEQIMDDLQAMISQTKANVRLRRNAVVHGDPSLLRQVLQNLVVNAMKFQQPGVVPEVNIEVTETPQQWVVSVADNGIGIQEINYEDIFGMFRRLHTHDEYEGTGLGLALCKRIVEIHGGEIWCVSHVGQGTTFFFTIPRKQKDLTV